MRHRLEEWVRALWDGRAGRLGALLSLVASPLELVFRTGAGFRNALFDRGWVRARRAPIPVISVGNLTVGGTGKTPVSAWIAEELRAQGAAVAVILRGYGDDEIRLHQRWNPGVPVFANRDRHRAVTAAAQDGASVAVLDDGFQHRRLARDLDVVLLTEEDDVRVRHLPCGPYREPFASLARADLVVVTRKGVAAQPPGPVERRIIADGRVASVVRLSLLPAGWFDVAGRRVGAPTGSLLAVAAIARPVHFAHLVGRVTQCDVELMSFADHHRFTPSDVRRIAAAARGRTIVTTEKDAVRLDAPLATPLEDVRVLRLRIEIDEGEERLRSALSRAAGLASSCSQRPVPSSEPTNGPPGRSDHDETRT